ncbi:ABC transporter ATP-binding protein [Clostridium botulinum]|nr:ABC transporter ATP-binding protein [Clostridium botulinum]
MNKKVVIKDLHFSYNSENEILKGLNLELDTTSTAIIGQNGAGKTTFVKLLKGLLKPTNGDIYICDKNTKEATAASLASKVGLVFQNPNDQIFKNKVIDEVMFGALNIGQDKETAYKNAIEALKMVHLEHLKDENPYDLNLSERKLISIASIISMDTDIVIFDEPTIAQDFQGKENIKNIIFELRKKGKLVITIIHDMDFVAECFERVIVFNKGAVLMDGTSREVFSKEDELKKAYLDAPHITKLCKKLGYKETFLTVDEFIKYKKENSLNEIISKDI